MVSTSEPWTISGVPASPIVSVSPTAFPTLFRTDTAKPSGRLPTGIPPRPAMRISRTESLCATRRDCCMSEMLVCTRVSLLLKSNSASTPSSTMTVTISETVTSMRVKPRWREARGNPAAVEAAIVSLMIPLHSEGLDDLQGDPLAVAEDVLLRVFDDHRHLLELNEGGLRPAGLGMVQVAVVEVADAVLADLRRAVPEGVAVAGGIGPPPLVGVADLGEVSRRPEVLGLPDHGAVRHHDPLVVERHLQQLFDLRPAVVRRLAGVVAADVVV